MASNKIGLENNWISKGKSISKFAFVFLGIIGSIFSVYGVILTKSDKHVYSILLTLCILGLIFGVSYLFNEREEKTTKQSERLAEHFHEVCHLLRDQFYLLEVFSKSKCSAGDFQKQVETGLRNIINEIAEALSQSTNCTVSACIKIFEFDKKMEENLQDMYITTLCRSANSGSKRNKFDGKAISVVNNTDFEYIMKGIDDYFAVPDLEKLKAEGSYNNTSTSWSRFYKTTIVAPIRIKRNLVNGSNKDFDTYDILGFLCVDSKKTNAFGMPFGPLCVEFVKAIADIIYIYLERSKQYYLNCLQKPEDVEAQEF